MMTKLAPTHLQRRAVVYLRQSSLTQVDHAESTRRMFALRERPLALGWPAQSIDVVDDDLGWSGRSTDGRFGFQRLSEGVVQGQIGAIFALDVSRFAETSADWPPLLDLCGLADVVIVDEQAIYSPRDHNDRVLLGINGTKLNSVSCRDLPFGAAPSRAKRLRSLLTSPDITILMEAHNGLSAKLAAEAGFPALWASGLSISAALGVRDNNEASWTQVLEVIEFMSDATELPILLDGDTGYGNFNNVRRLVRKLEQRNVAGVCLEDKRFPKTNSFISGEKQALADVDEFCGKLRAAKDTQTDPDFVVVARTEAFIAGWGLEESLLRATAYADNCADLVLVHSARADSQEIMAFMKRWDNRVPVIIVPTKYPSEPLSKFVEVGLSNFIFANHALRSVVTILQRNLRILHDTRDLMSIEKEIASVNEVFRLQNVQELKTSEKRYLPATENKEIRALVLAASKGDFGDLVADKPKAMLRLRGKPILAWQADTFRRQGVRSIAAVRGYCKEAFDVASLQYFDNDMYAETGELASLYAARDFLKGDLVIAYGDIVFDDFILGNLLRQDGDIGLAVDAAWKLRDRGDNRRDLVVTAGAHDPLGNASCQLRRIGAGVKRDDVSGEWIGLLHLKAPKTELLVKLLDKIAQTEPNLLRTGDVSDLLNRLVAAGEEVTVVHSYGHWYNLDDHKDLALASEQLSS
jgi:phosphoenolpyruvate phosphomutase